MEFELNIGTLTNTGSEYGNLMTILSGLKENIDKAIVDLTECGWSGEAKDKFELAHTAKQELYIKFQNDIEYMRSALEHEEKPRAVKLRIQSEDFLNCIKRSGSESPNTNSDSGIISLAYGGLYPINNNVDNCTTNYYKSMNSDFEEIINIANNLEYTSFSIGGDVFTAESYIRNQTTSLTDFDESFNMYYNGVKQMESNICSVLAKISGVSDISKFKSSSVISASGEIDTNKVQDAMLKDSEDLTDEEKELLAYVENIWGEDKYDKLREAYITMKEQNVSKAPIAGLSYFNYATKYNIGDKVQLCAPNGQYFAATVTSFKNGVIPEIAYDDPKGYAAACNVTNIGGVGAANVVSNIYDYSVNAEMAQEQSDEIVRQGNVQLLNNVKDYAVTAEMLQEQSDEIVRQGNEQLINNMADYAVKAEMLQANTNNVEQEGYNQLAGDIENGFNNIIDGTKDLYNNIGDVIMNNHIILGGGGSASATALAGKEGGSVSKQLDISNGDSDTLATSDIGWATNFSAGMGVFLQVTVADNGISDMLGDSDTTGFTLGPVSIDVSTADHATSYTVNIGQHGVEGHTTKSKTISAKETGKQLSDFGNGYIEYIGEQIPGYADQDTNQMTDQEKKEKEANDVMYKTMEEALGYNDGK